LDDPVAIVAEAPDDGHVVENGVFALLQELGHRVVVQTVIAGGPDAEETVTGTMALLAATDVPIILWLNEHLGPLELQGRRLPMQHSCMTRATGSSEPCCCRRARRPPSARTPRTCCASD
jgi:hypothetical protein